MILLIQSHSSLHVLRQIACVRSDYDFETKAVVRICRSLEFISIKSQHVYVKYNLYRPVPRKAIEAVNPHVYFISIFCACD